MRIWEDLSTCDYQQITLMCNDTKAVDQRESDPEGCFPARWTETAPPPYPVNRLDHPKIPPIGRMMVKLLFGVFAAVFLVLGLLALGISTSLIGGGTPSQQAQQDIPPQLLPVYQTAADSCPGLPWSVLAAIGKVETDHARSTAPGVQLGGQLRRGRRAHADRHRRQGRQHLGRLRDRRRRRRGRRLQPGRRHLHRRQLPLPERRQQGRGCGRGGLRLQPRRLVRDQGPGHRLDLRRQPGPAPRRPRRGGRRRGRPVRLRQARPALQVGRHRRARLLRLLGPDAARLPGRRDRAAPDLARAVEVRHPGLERGRHAPRRPGLLRLQHRRPGDHPPRRHLHRGRQHDRRPLHRRQRPHHPVHARRLHRRRPPHRRPGPGGRGHGHHRPGRTDRPSRGRRG